MVALQHNVKVPNFEDFSLELNHQIMFKIPKYECLNVQLYYHSDLF